MQCIFKVLNYSFPLSWIYHLICERYHRGAKQHSGCSCRDTVQMALLKTSNTKSGLEIKEAEWGQFGLCSTAKENHLGENSACCRYFSLTSIQNKTEWLGLQGKKIQTKIWLNSLVISLMMRAFCPKTPGKITTENLKEIRYKLNSAMFLLCCRKEEHKNVCI